MTLQVIISGSIPDISNQASVHIKFNARQAQFGRAEHWRCLGYKFKSYVGQNK